MVDFSADNFETMPTASSVGTDGKSVSKKQQTLFKLGTVSKCDKFGYKFHDAVINGNVKTARKVLKKGIAADYVNDQQQTPLFIACYHGKERIVELLIKYGADPNYRCGDGQYTPVHGACASGNPKILCRLIEAGGDLRLHDKHGFTPSDWCNMIQNPKKSQQILEYIETARIYAMSKSGQDLLLEKKPSVYDKLSTIKEEKNGKGLFKRTSHSLITRESSIHSLGFGKVYMPSLSHAGSLAYIPYIAEVALKPDLQSISYQTAGLFAMESSKWGYNKVTIKKLTSANPSEGAFIDLLINEKDFLCQLRHPSLLLLMGICNTNNLDSMWLVFERVELGTLFYQLHHLKVSRAMSIGTGCELMLQVCEALIYLHNMGYFHCNVSSHSIHLTQSRIAKLADLEFMVERDFDSENQKRSKVRHIISPISTYNWMAPELMAGEPPSVKSDIYSFSTVLWEILTGDIPWGESPPLAIKRKLLDENEVLYAMVAENKVVSKPYNEVLLANLAVSPEKRVFNLEQMAMILKGASLKLAKQERPTSIDSRFSREVIKEQKMSEPSIDTDNVKSRTGYVAACVNRVQHVLTSTFRRHREQSVDKLKMAECQKSKLTTESVTTSESQEIGHIEATSVDIIEMDQESAVNGATNRFQAETVAFSVVSSSLDSKMSTATVYENSSNASISNSENSVQERLETQLSAQWFAGKGSVKNLVSSVEVQTEMTVDRSQLGKSTFSKGSKETLSEPLQATTSLSSSIEAVTDEQHINNHSEAVSSDKLFENIETCSSKNKQQSEVVSSDHQCEEQQEGGEDEAASSEQQADAVKAVKSEQNLKGTEDTLSEKCDVVSSEQQADDEDRAVSSEQQGSGIEAVTSEQQLTGPENWYIASDQQDGDDENRAVSAELPRAVKSKQRLKDTKEILPENCDTVSSEQQECDGHKKETQSSEQQAGGTEAVKSKQQSEAL